MEGEYVAVCILSSFSILLSSSFCTFCRRRSITIANARSSTSYKYINFALFSFSFLLLFPIFRQVFPHTNCLAEESANSAMKFQRGEVEMLAQKSGMVQLSEISDSQLERYIRCQTKQNKTKQNKTKQNKTKQK